MCSPDVLPLRGPARNENCLKHDKPKPQSHGLYVLRDDRHSPLTGSSSNLNAAAETLYSLLIWPKMFRLLKTSMGTRS